MPNAISEEEVTTVVITWPVEFAILWRSMRMCLETVGRLIREKVIYLEHGLWWVEREVLRCWA